MTRAAPRGVSVSRRGPSWRVRWRQNEVQPDGSTKRVWATQTRQTEAEAVRFAWEVKETLDAKGYWLEAPRGSLARPLDEDLEAVVAVSWLAWKRDTRGVRPATLSAIAGALHRTFSAFREACGIEPGEPVPCSQLTIENFSKMNGVLQRRYRGGTPYQTAAAAYDLWCWASDMGRWATLAPAPRTSALVLPRQHMYAAPSLEPTVAEADAMLRALAFPARARRYGPEPLRLSIIQRYTGLRIEQAAAIRREDLDPDRCTLLIRHGKSAREQALHRSVPVSPHLLTDLAGWLRAAPPGPLFPNLRSPRNTTRWVTDAWQRAEDEGHVRAGVVQPPNRAKPRPTHVMRALFQSVLQEGGAGDRVVDHLVGHAPRDTRGRSYVAPSWDALRAAVAAIPSIDWGEGRCSPEAERALRLLPSPTDEPAREVNRYGEPRS